MDACRRTWVVLVLLSVELCPFHFPHWSYKTHFVFVLSTLDI